MFGRAVLIAVEFFVVRTQLILAAHMVGHSFRRLREINDGIEVIDLHAGVPDASRPVTPSHRSGWVEF